MGQNQHYWFWLCPSIQTEVRWGGSGVQRGVQVLRGRGALSMGLVVHQQLRLCLNLVWPLERSRIGVEMRLQFAISPHALGCISAVPQNLVSWMSHCSCSASVLIVLCFSCALILLNMVSGLACVWFSRTGKIVSVSSPRWWYFSDR